MSSNDAAAANAASAAQDAVLEASLSAQEVIEIVDENNVILEPKPRWIMRRDKLIHRATYAFVKTSSNYFYVQKRSKIKDYCPGFFDPTPGGVVAAGESYERTNEREVEEEMGIKPSYLKKPMSHLFTFYFQDHRVKCWGDAWEVTYDGPLKLQEEEVERVEMMTMKEILDRYEQGLLEQDADAGTDAVDSEIDRFTPDSIHACKEYVKLKGVLEPIGPRPEVSFYTD